MYQPGEFEGGKGRATDPVWYVDVYEIDYNIVTQGIRVYYLKKPAPQREFVKEEVLIVPADTVGSHKHYENTPMQYTEIFCCCKNEIFTGKNLIFFLIFAQNIDFRYTLEPLRRGGSNE